MLVVDPLTIKLLTAKLPIIDIDADDASGSGHTLRVAFDAATTDAVTSAPISAADTVDLGYAHGFSAGQRVFYCHGGGDSIGGLANKNEYFVIPFSDTAIRLAKTQQLEMSIRYVEPENRRYDDELAILRI